MASSGAHSLSIPLRAASGALVTLLEIPLEQLEQPQCPGALRSSRRDCCQFGKGPRAAAQPKSDHGIG